MPISAIEQGLYSTLIAGAVFDASNVSYMDWSIVGRGTGGYAAIILPATLDYELLTFGNIGEYRWSVPVVVVVPQQSAVTRVHANIVATQQEVADRLATDLTLGGSCDLLEFQLMSMDEEELRGTRWNLQYWLVLATEWR